MPIYHIYRSIYQSIKATFRITAILGLLSLLSTAMISGAPPHPDMLERTAQGKVHVPYFLNHLDEMHANGICTGDKYHDRNCKTSVRKAQAVTNLSSPFKVLAILVEFSDHASGVSPAFFDSLIYGTQGRTVRDYYDEVSYGQIDIVTVNAPSELGWHTAPQTYAYYVNGENGVGIGSYPNNTQRLVEDLVDQIDSLVDFSDYDNDGDGYVDILMIVHSGRGAEYSGSDNDIWSHKWGINPRLKDGVYLSDYTIYPEYQRSPGDMTIGVYAHELGHGFGLPDLYDTDYTSKGIGNWGIMSYGTWLGPHGRGGCPAHFCAWSKAQMGILTPTNVTTNLSQEPISNIEQNPEAYRLWYAGSASNEYFLIENRQKIGYDAYLPGSGLLIWHIDEDRSSNTNEWRPGFSAAGHFEVALEQADGLFELEKSIDGGDSGDPYTAGGTAFNTLSAPNSDSYSGSPSFVSVENISPSGDTMYADMRVAFSSGGDDGNDESPTLPEFTHLNQNYPNPFNPTTTISFSTDHTAYARLDIYNTLGQRVATVLDGDITAGVWTATWDATDNNGNRVASGIYFYTLAVDGCQLTKKMALTR